MVIGVPSVVKLLISAFSVNQHELCMHSVIDSMPLTSTNSANALGHLAHRSAFLNWSGVHCTWLSVVPHPERLYVMAVEFSNFDKISYFIIDQLFFLHLQLSSPSC